MVVISEDPTPLTIGGLQLSQVASHLRRAAANAARFAIANYSIDEYDPQIVSAIRTGMAVELLALSIIAEESPALIADANDIPSHLFLAGVTGVGAMDAGKLKTITAQNAMDRIRAMHPKFNYPVDAYKQLLAVRNAAVHTGLVERPALESAVLTMVTMTESMLKLLGSDSDAYWGTRNLSLVGLMLDRKRDQLERRIKSKTVRAIEKLSELRALFAPNLEAGFLNLESHPVLFLPDHDAQRRKCPICDRSGWLIFKTIEIQALAMVDPAGHTTVVQHLMGNPDAFECPVCGFLLQNEELDEYPALGGLLDLPGRTFTAEEYAERFGSMRPLGIDQETSMILFSEDRSNRKAD